MPRDTSRDRSLLRATAAWWETDRHRLRLIRTVAYLLFIASIAGTVYSGIRGVLPVWAITLYAAFAIQFIFMTFMYAIKHSGEEEIRHSIYALRRERVPEWQFQTEMVAEFARIVFCTEHRIDPAPPTPTGLSQLRQRKALWPAIDSTAETCKYARAALEEKLNNIQAVQTEKRPPSDESLALRLDFIAYSSETLITLSREVAAELDDVLQSTGTRYDGQIIVRVLIRDTSDSSQWLVPLAIDEEKDGEYASDLRTRFRNVSRSALREFQESLKDIFSSKQVDFRVRGYRLEPLVKGVLIDAKKGVFGLYTVSPLKDPDGWDYSGHAVTMCPCNVEGSFVESTAAGFLKSWFDLLWNSSHLSRSLD